ncbi:hypothetical protein GE061_004241 [Apolygus lucorum]|uniref:Uncharacterized protein n=1 Tax=Apolygus lucorum TaxID=248454 RepID=A0A6A4J757_APOLU|nr:hypothetical protein GE061_004241 [Apolygus lucorum]
MDTGQCIYCHAMLKSLCVPCQFKVHMMHSGPVDKVCDAGETGNPNCKSCDYYVEIISKLTADVCEDELVKIIMSSIAESQNCDKKKAAQNKTSKSESKTLTNAVASFLQGQADCSADATRKLLDSLKQNEANEKRESFPNFKEPSSPQNVSIVLPVEVSSQRTSIAAATADRRSKSQLSNQKSQLSTQRRNSDPKKIKRTSYSESVKSEPRSANPSMKEINMAQFASTKTIRRHSFLEENYDLEKSTNSLPSSYRKKSLDEEYKGVYSAQPNQAQYMSNKNTKKPSIDGNNEIREASTSRSRNLGEVHSSSLKGKEQSEMQHVKSKNSKKRSLYDEYEQESTDNRASKGVMKNLYGGTKESYGRSSVEDNKRDELDEKIDRCLERFYRERLKSPERESRSRSPCSGRTERIARSRSSRSAHGELYYPVTVAFRSRSCGNVEGELYGESILFPTKKSRGSDERRSRSGERKLFYQADSDGQFKSVFITMSGEDSGTDSDGNIEINFQRKSTRCCSPVMMDKGEQASGFTDACTQYYETDGAKSKSLTILENIGSSSQPGMKESSNKIPKRSSSPAGKRGARQSSGSRKSPSRQNSAGRPGSATKIGKHKQSDASRSKFSTNKTQNLRQPQWQH